MVTWIRYSTQGGDPKDVRFHPGNPDIVYGCSAHGSVCGFSVSTRKVGRKIVSIAQPVHSSNKLYLHFLLADLLLKAYTYQTSLARLTLRRQEQFIEWPVSTCTISVLRGQYFPSHNVWKQELMHSLSLVPVSAVKALFSSLSCLCLGSK